MTSRLFFNHLATFSFIACLSCLAQAEEKIEFPKDELATESVLPVLDQPRAVVNRAITTDGRFEVGFQGGQLLNEAFFADYNIGLMGTYHFSEKNALNVQYNHWFDGESEFKEQLESQNLINLEGGPAIEDMLLVSYQHTPWYGKMSLTKNTISHNHLYVLVGGAAVKVGGDFNPGVNFGLGQKFYLSSRIALRFDLRGVVFRGPDILSRTFSQNNVPDTSEFEKEWFVNSLLTAGVIILL